MHKIWAVYEDGSVHPVAGWIGVKDPIVIKNGQVLASSRGIDRYLVEGCTAKDTKKVGTDERRKA